MQTVTYQNKQKKDYTKADTLSFYKNRYGVRLLSSDSAEKDIHAIQKSLYKYHKVFNELVLVQSKFEKPGKFHDRKRQVSRLIGCDVHAKSWVDLSAKVHNLYLDFYKLKYSNCKKDIYNYLKIKQYKDSSKLEGVFYSSRESAKKLDDLYLLYYKSEK
jgi:hypothetical protein